MTGLALLALATAPAWAQGPVVGTITDARTGEALPGATILLDGAAVGSTNPAGAFQLAAVPAGAHELRSANSRAALSLASTASLL